MNSNAKLLFGLTLALALLVLTHPLKVFAQYQIYAPGTPVTVGDFVYDDSFNPTTSPCSIVIADPSGNNVVTATTTGDSTGWHSYTFTPVPVSGPTTGVWPAVLSCGGIATGDLVKEDRSFIVGSASVDTTTLTSNITSSINSASSSIGNLIGGLNNVSTSSVASAVWNNPTRNLTDYATSSIASAIWTSPTRTLSSFGNLVSDVATAVWSSGSRTLTAFGSLAADVWNNSYAPTRELTDQTLTSGGSIATQTDVLNASSTIIAAVLNNSSLISSLNNISAAQVWAYGARTLTSSSSPVDLTASSTLAIWNEAVSNLTSPGSIGQQIANNLDTTISSRGTATVTAASIWSAATRTLTDYSTSSVASAVWANAARTLTSYGNNLSAADVWNTLTSSLTTTGSIGAQVAGVSTSTIASAVWNNSTRNLTDYATSSIASAIWTSPTRTLTAFGALAADVWNNVYTPTRELTDQTLTSGGKIATQTDVNNASSTIMAAVLNNSALISSLNNISAAQVWAYGSRTVTGGTVDLTTTSTQAVWNVATSTLATTGSVGQQLVQNLDAQVSSRGTSSITAADVWAAATRTLTDYSTSSVASAAATAVWANAARTLTNYGNNISAADVWNVLTSSLTTTGTIGAQLAGVSTSTIASAVWNNPTRNLTDYATSSIASAIWTSPTRTLSAFGALAADIWNNAYAPTRELTDQTLTSGGKIATQTDVNNASSTIIAAILNNTTLINNLHNISAADVWSYGSRSLNGSAGTVDLTASSTLAIWNEAAANLTSPGSIGQQIANNLDTTISSRGTSTSTLTAADIWSAATRTLTDYSTSSVASAVWANAARTLTSYGNNISAADVWNVLTSSLTTTGTIGAQLAGVSTTSLASSISTTTIASAVWTNPTRTLTSFGSLVPDIWNYLGNAIHSGSSGNWVTSLSDTQNILAGNLYQATVYVTDSGFETDSYVTPTITIYDTNRNVVVSAAAMTRTGTGVYTYSYSVPGGAVQGQWESVVETQVDSLGTTIQTSDYWQVSGSPAQVIIRDMANTTVPTAAADITITNEGSSGYEYAYDWCVVSSASDPCGSPSNIFYESAAKFIVNGQSWDTTLTANVPNPGIYYFKVVVYYGTQSSGSSRTFTETASSSNPTPPSPGGGGGGGGGGGAPPSTTATPVSTIGTCNGADFNLDGTVNSTDFSILLYFWQTRPPFANKCVDVNQDGRVDSVDFSILLYQWGSGGIPFKKP